MIDWQVDARIRRRLPAGLALLCLTGMLLALFGPILFRDHQFAFRDAGHYYYPLLERVQQEWDAGRWPLWAPEASAGMPLLGTPTAAVLYPGKLVFALLPYPWAMRVYLVGHVVLAFVAMGALLRGWKVSTSGALLGALAYAFGVPVLSQTSNMIFLVGAAWTPLGFLAADRWVRCRCRAALPGLALVLALQVLGGDPEAAYLIILCAAGYAVGLAVTSGSGRNRLGRKIAWAGLGLVAAYLALLGLSWWSARAIRALSVAAPGMPRPWVPPQTWLVVAAWSVVAALVVRRARRGSEAWGLAAPLVGLVVAGFVALAITGAQLVPILESSGMSFRAARAEGFHDIYAYSARPLQFLDALWPGVFGTLEGGYRSWLNALPPKTSSRFWMPSVYLGGLTLVLAAASFGGRGGPPWRAWLSVVAVLSFLASLGYYGSPLFWARQVPGWDATLGPLEPAFSWQVRSDGHLRDGDGGVYWLLATGLPGFGSFRYPPKLLVFWALAVSGLAGLGWDRLTTGQSRRAAVVAWSLLAASLLALVVSWLGAEPLQAWFDNLAERLRDSDEPLDPIRAVADLRAALGYTAVVLGMVLGLLSLASRRPALAGALAVLGLTIDLGLANADNVVTVPQAAFEETPRALEIIREAEHANPSPGPFRVQRVGNWWPLSWSADSAPRPFERIVRWERQTLRPHYGLPLGVRSTFYFDTLELLDYGLFFLPWSLQPDPATARTHGLKPGQTVWYYPRRGFDLWNTRYFIVPAKLVWDSYARGYAAFIPDSTFIYPSLDAFKGPDGPARRARWEASEDFRILRNEAAFPRAWVVHQAYLDPEVRGLRVADRARTMQQLLYQGDEFWRLPGQVVRDPRQVAWVETDRPEEVRRWLSGAGPDPSETVTVTRDEPQRVELTAVLRSPGLVVISDLYYPGWKLTVDGQPAEILRTNRAMRGVTLPAGTHRLVFQYEPFSFRLGITLSLVGLVMLGALGAWALRRPRLADRGPEHGEPGAGAIS